MREQTMRSLISLVISVVQLTAHAPVTNIPLEQYCRFTVLSSYSEPYDVKKRHFAHASLAELTHEELLACQEELGGTLFRRGSRHVKGSEYGMEETCIGNTGRSVLIVGCVYSQKVVKEKHETEKHW